MPSSSNPAGWPLMRRTVVVSDRHAADLARVAFARRHAHGAQIFKIEQVAARLAGGFFRPVGQEELDGAIADALDQNLGELNPIKALPGFASAAGSTLQKVWRADIDLQARADAHPRLGALARLEAAVLARLPSAMLRPRDLVGEALQRLRHAPQVLGPIEILGRTEMAPCWRALVRELAGIVSVHWIAGPRSIPSWLEGTRIEVIASSPHAPDHVGISCSDPRHEALEAVRWVRGLLARGVAAHDIAIVAATTGEYDAHLLAISADANLDVHFVHGRPVLTTREGQAAAALAEALIGGPDQEAVRRLFAKTRSLSKSVAELPQEWTRLVPRDVPLPTLERWTHALGAHAGTEREPTCTALLELVRLLAQGPDASAAAGERFLSGVALAIWRKALSRGPAAAVDSTLTRLRLADDHDGANTVAWMPAGALAASPRSHVRLLGLMSRNWPRAISEDALLPDHVVPLSELDPLPVSEADRRDFHTILRTTTTTVTLSWSRRDATGRALGRSPLVPRDIAITHLSRTTIPLHAASEADRLFSRLEEFSAAPQARSASTCWRDWHRSEITAHDGLVRAGHPVIAQILVRPQSATSLALLLRDPLGYVWRYGLRLEAPATSAQPMTLDPASFGNLVHAILEAATRDLEDKGGFARATPEEVDAAFARARSDIAAQWEASVAVPPALLWSQTLNQAENLALEALDTALAPLPGQRTFVEVGFGLESDEDGRDAPWATTQPISIPGTTLTLRGKIDRLDISGDGKRVRVIDYKTGGVPKDIDTRQLSGGSELQRSIYAFAVASLLGETIHTEASLLYPGKAGGLFPLENPHLVLDRLSDYLKCASDNLRRGLALPGVGAGGSYDERVFALPASAAIHYLPRKDAAMRALLGTLTQAWEEI